MQEKLENKSSVRIPNDQGGPQTNLGSIWYHTEPSYVPYSPNQFLGWDFFCRFLQQGLLDLSYSVTTLEVDKPDFFGSN